MGPRNGVRAIKSNFTAPKAKKVLHRLLEKQAVIGSNLSCGNSQIMKIGYVSSLGVITYQWPTRNFPNKKNPGAMGPAQPRTAG
jgi:hypothetical protein